MFTPALTALALVMAALHHAPLALQAVPDLPVEEDTLEETRPDIEEALPALPDAVDLSETSVKTSDPVSIERVRDEIETDLAPAPDTADLAAPVEDVPITTAAALSAAEQSTILTEVSAALSAARTAKGKFQQINADGSLSTGSFALRRPGRVRFEYDDPTPILIVSDGATVAMEDRDLETVDRVPLSSTPLGLLLDDQLDFSDDVDVINVFRNEDRTSITVQDATGEVEGDLTMIFATGSYELLGWLTLDADFHTTVVELSDVEQNSRLNPRLFRLDEDEDDDR